MKKKYAIITTGTSIYNETNIFYDMKEKNDIDEKLWREKITEIKNQEKFDITKVSAEINVLNSLKMEGKFNKLYFVTLIHSETLLGKTSAIGVKTCISECFDIPLGLIELREIPGLDMNSKSEFLTSMNELIEIMTNLLDKEYGEVKEQTLFIPIGGYKSVTMIAHLMGDLHGFTSWYQHEESSHVLAIPRIPVKIDKKTYLEEPLEDVIKRFFCAANYTFKDFIKQEMILDKDIETIRNNSHLFYQIGNEIAFSPIVAGILEEIQNEKASYLPNVHVRENVKDKNNFKLFIKYFLKNWHLYSSSPQKNVDLMHHEYSIKSFPQNNQKGICRFRADKKPCRGIYHISEDKKDIYFDKIEFDHDEYDRALNDQYIDRIFKESFNKDNYQKIEEDYLKNIKLF